MKKIALVFALLLPFVALAQEKGIHFIQFKNWQEVINEAKRTNKNIFVDAYTTWCGPCKKMDKEVFTDERIGTFVNDRFIAVKIQFDKSKSDNNIIKGWYNDAESLQKKFDVNAFPTHLFFSSEGKIIDRAIGFQNTDVFMNIINRANDPTLNLAGQIQKFNQGKLANDEMLKLALSAKQSKQDSVALVVGRAYKKKAIDGRSPNEIINPDLFQFISKFYDLFFIKDQLTEYLYRNPEKSDIGMGQTYSRSFTDYIILKDMINVEVMPNGQFAKKSPNWRTLEKKVARRYDIDVSKRMINIAKLNWYQYVKDWDNVIRYTIERTERGGVDTSGILGAMLNNMVFDVIFQHGTKVDQLKKGVEYMELLLSNDDSNHIYMDTYANLLYKLGEKKKAIKEQQKAIVIAKERKDIAVIEEMELTLGKMRKDEPTWLLQ